MPVLFSFQPAFADTDPYSDDRTHHTGVMLNVIRNQFPNLPYALRDPAGWMKNGIEGLDETDPGAIALRSLMSSLQTPGNDQGEAAWLSPGYHHKGFLPMNDALLMGVNLRHRLWGESTQLDIHPFFGQNWHSTDNYWGTEIGINLRPDALQKPWGRIALRYNNGDNSLMDSNRGFDMHSEINFDEHLSLHAGVNRQETSDIGNYVLLRWKLLSD